MRFCVNCRHMGKTKSQAQELKVDYKDIEFIDDYIEKEQKQHYIVLKIPKEVIPDWELLNMYNEKMEEIDTARHPEEIINISINIPFEVEEYSMMRIKV